MREGQPCSVGRRFTFVTIFFSVLEPGTRVLSYVTKPDIVLCSKSVNVLVLLRYELLFTERILAPV